ncbi:MAG: TonB family protein [Aridibacter famidurans]|nr:TonB family protein [Aridibacter famidurans]
MKRSVVLLVLLVFQAVISLQAAPHRPVRGTLDEPKWKEISHDGFTAQIPDSSFKIWSFDEEDLKYWNFSAETATAWYYAFAYDKLKNSPLMELLRFARFNAAEHSDVTIDGVPGKRLTFREIGSLKHEALVFQVRERVFIFHAVSKHRVRPGTDELLDNSEVEQFFSSIRLDFVKDEILESPHKLSNLVNSFLDESKSDQTKDEPMFRVQRIPGSSPTTAGSGQGTGSGSGSGSGSGVGSGPPREDSSLNDSPLRILSKARPGYTDLARHYDLSGRVVLRVSFLADGTVGAVSVFEALPLGLTENAIRAAKLMRFEPASRNGRAYTVNKAVHYNFTIY